MSRSRPSVPPPAPTSAIAAHDGPDILRALRALADPAHRPWWIALGLWLVMAGVASVALWQVRRTAVDSLSRELGLLSLTLADGIDRGLRGADEGLHALQAELAEGRLDLRGDAARRALATRAGLMPLVETLWLVDESGHVLAASDDLPVPALEGFHPALATLAGSAPGATAIGRPFLARSAMATGPAPGAAEAQVALAARFQGPSGQPVGWILAAMPASALLGALGSTVTADDTRAWAVRQDGVLLASLGEPPGRVARLEPVDLTAGPSPPRAVLRRLDDGRDHLVARRSVPHDGVQVVIARELSSALTTWRQESELAAAALAVLLLVITGAVHRVQQADRRHAEAERALQAQVSRAGKLESLGTLAGGVAHDFNNVLAGIVGYGELAHEAAAPGSDQARHLDRVLQAAQRGRALVERILAFSRGGARTSAVFELEPVVDDVLALLAASLRPGIALDRRIAASGGRLRGDPTQVFQAVMNLCTNALQAMPDGGRLTVHLVREAVSEARVLSHTRLRPGSHLRLTVADEGAGITPEVMDHLFEPFFTTRAAASGTGLGLAVVFGVVTEFGGAIDVRSVPGAGASFTLYLPECTDPLPPRAVNERARAPGQGERLLVVDDEPDLAALARELLLGLGYAPVVFTDPAAARQAFEADPDGFAALVTDEVMPGLSGSELARAVRARAPGCPVLLVSGYGGAGLADRARAAGADRVLGKPLTRGELADALAEALQRAERPR